MQMFKLWYFVNALYFTLIHVYALNLWRTTGVVWPAAASPILSEYLRWNK